MKVLFVGKERLFKLHGSLKLASDIVTYYPTVKQIYGL